jgi:GNAT superfamily N-acetyltransferase
VNALSRRDRGSSPWRRAVASDLPALAAFLAAREERCAGFAGRILRDGELHLPSSLRGGICIAERGSETTDSGFVGSGAVASHIVGALLCHPSRLAMPLLPEDDISDGLLGGLLASRGWSPASAIGRPADLDRLIRLCGLGIKVSVVYRLMRFRAAALDSSGASALVSPNAAFADPAGPASIVVRLAAPGDLEALLPLQKAYELEEVLTPVHRFDAAACRAALARSLKEQLIFVAEESGVIVAKGGTNARGLGYDQIGGVYTLPERRGRGIATALVGRLVAAIAALNRGIVLFVKPGNAAAISLYRGLGFEDIGPYRADYFDE